MDTKKWYQSKAIWAGIVTALIGAAQGVAQVFGVDLNSFWWFSIAITMLGGLGIYGRATATTKIEQ